MPETTRPLDSKPAWVALLERVIGSSRSRALSATLELPPLPGAGANRAPRAGISRVSRAEISCALAALLFEDVLERVPEARAYVAELRASGRRLTLDHGAIRTVAAPSGQLPSGREAFRRFLEPLGYEQRGVYPLTRLGMTGYAYAHADLPEQLPQYFVSELHPELFSEEFAQAASRVVGSSSDPLPAESHEALEQLSLSGSLDADSAARLLPNLFACFDRQHDIPTLADHAALANESKEMAWIATEGQAFNHATDRVTDIASVADEQRAKGRAIKAELETSASGRIVQTAFLAAPVQRLFLDANCEVVTRTVPGSFHEFIWRGRLDDGSLDLSFDSSNAQGIFAMTRVEVGQ